MKIRLEELPDKSELDCTETRKLAEVLENAEVIVENGEKRYVLNFGQGEPYDGFREDIKRLLAYEGKEYGEINIDLTEEFLGEFKDDE